MGKKVRELAKGQARLEGKIDILAAAVRQPQREGTWTKFNIVATLILTALSFAVGTMLALRQTRQAKLANVISAEALGADTAQEESERADSALWKWGRGEFTDTALRPEAPREPRGASPPPAPRLTGVMRADSGKVDSVVAQLSAASSPIIPMDSAGNPYMREPDGRARIQLPADGPAGTQGLSGAGGMRAARGFSNGGGPKGLWVGPYGELICAGTCAPGQVCCSELTAIQR